MKQLDRIHQEHDPEQEIIVYESNPIDGFLEMDDCPQILPRQCRALLNSRAKESGGGNENAVLVSSLTSDAWQG